ncbi:MAG: flagellar basal body rod protein FlgB [Porticoccaceae bacterium]|nr:flagellar basal body rod protein FlgB [Porticoccaceae bacterium]|tara:strand:+ start:161 stop:547 length:387 start_codon:yes stop_codon:yes gene_type:complete
MKLIDSAFGIHERALTLRSQRMEILSRNIANADTPNFKAQDVDFKSSLEGVQSGRTLKATHSGHVQSLNNSGGGTLIYTVPINSSADGNTVELSVEQAKYGKAAAQYQATLRFLEGDISAIRKVLRGD